MAAENSSTKTPVCIKDNCESPRKIGCKVCAKHASSDRRAMLAASGVKCKVDHCNCPVESMKNGLCQKHTARLRRYGSPTHMQGTEDGAPLAWLRHLVETLPLQNACIEWPFNIDVHGYGSIWGKKKLLKAHRASLGLSQGLPLDQLPSRDIHARHLCPNGHNRKCVNPLHLAWGTHGDNMADSIPYGTQKGSNNPQSKLNEDQVLQILLDKRVAREISDDYDVSENQIKNIKNRIQWTHVKLPKEDQAA